MGSSTLVRDPTTGRLSRLTSLAYGLTYCLVYGLTVWGIDARALARSNAELAGAKLAAGSPLLLLVGATTGTLVGRSRRAGAWVGAWIAGGVLMGAVVGAVPYASLNLATWMVEPRLRGINVYPMGTAGMARMAFAAALTGCVGSVVGLAGYVLAERARGLLVPKDRPDAPLAQSRWAVFALVLPLAILPALVADEVANRPLRAGQQVVHQAISISPAARDEGPIPPVLSTDLRPGAEGPDPAPYRDLFSATGYTLHRVGYDLETLDQQVIDAAFENGVVVRCRVSGRALAGCLTIAPEFAGWMEALVQAGLGAGPGMALASSAGRLSVDEETLGWLASQREVMGAQYEISRDAQHGGWVVMAARFENGYTLTCDFYGDAPVVLQGCDLAQPL